MPKQFCFIMNFVGVCAERIWDFWSLADDVSGWLWLYRYYKTYTNYN